MHHSHRYDVPARLALLYDFVNSLDRRHYVEHGTAHAGGDELATLAAFGRWLADRSLQSRPSPDAHAKALRLREALRALLKLAPAARGNAPEAHRFNAVAADFPLVIAAQADGLAFCPAEPSAAVGRVLAQLYRLSASGELDRLKMCASDECEWVFFDRSKPGNRRWCSSQRCGNRQKTRAYRQRQRSQA